MMKTKWLCLLLCICAAALLCTPVSAAAPDGFESLPESEEFEEILTLQDAVLNNLNGITPLERPDQTIVFTPEDMHWDRAYKLYIETNIYELEDTSPQGIRQALTNEHAIWQLPLSKDGFYCLVDFSVDSPLTPEVAAGLTEEERQYAQELEGKWGSHTVTIREDSSTYRDEFEELLQSNGLDAAPVKLLLGRTPKMRSLSGVAMVGDEVYVILLEKPHLMGELQPTTRSALPELEENQVYTFDEMAQVIRAVSQAENETGIAGGAGDSPVNEPPNYAMLVLLSAACGAVVLAVCLIGRRHSKKLL